MKIAFVLFTMLFHLSFLTAQDVKKYAETMKEADEYMLANDFKEAIPLLLSLKNSSDNSSNVDYKLGICYLHSNANVSLAIKYFKLAIVGISSSYNENDENERNSSQRTYLYLGDAFRLLNQLQNARTAYKNYSQILKSDDIAGIITVQKRIYECHMARALMLDPIPSKMSNAGNINSHGLSNYSGCISGDGNTLVFLRSMKFYEAIFLCKRSGINWSEPEEITSKIGSDGEFIPTGLNYNGTKMLLTSLTLISGNDIYECSLSNDKWSKAKKLTFQVSSQYNDCDAVYSHDDKEIYFSSNRENGFGGYDLYKSSKDESGNWSNVINLGKSVNTPSDERSPALLNDSRMLIYSSNASTGMGGFDLYYARINNNGDFSTSYNVGYPINTTGDDLNFKPINRFGDAVVSRYDANSAGDLDLFFVHYDSFSKFRKISVNGKMTVNGDQSWSKPIDLFFVDKNSGDTIQTASILSENYETMLYPGNFILNTSRNFSQPFVISTDTSLRDFELVSVISDAIVPDNKIDKIIVATDPVKINTPNILSSDTLIVKDILFNFNEYAIIGTEVLKLNDLLKKLSRCKGVSIRVAGYTDAVGLSAFNIKLAKQRAQEVKNYLLANGLANANISVDAFGSVNFVAQNTNADGTDNPAGRALNRRVEITINVKTPTLIIIHNNNITSQQNR